MVTLEGEVNKCSDDKDTSATHLQNHPTSLTPHNSHPSSISPELTTLNKTPDFTTVTKGRHRQTENTNAKQLKMNTLRKTNTTITVPQKINTKIEGQKYQKAKSRTDHSKSWRNSPTSTPPDVSPPTIPPKAEPFKTNKPFRGNHRNPLQAITDKMEIQHLPTLYSSDIKIATINVNSLSHEKMQLILTYIKHLYTPGGEFEKALLADTHTQ